MAFHQKECWWNGFFLFRFLCMQKFCRACFHNGEENLWYVFAVLWRIKYLEARMNSKICAHNLDRTSVIQKKVWALNSYNFGTQTMKSKSLDMYLWNIFHYKQIICILWSSNKLTKFSVVIKCLTMLLIAAGVWS